MAREGRVARPPVYDFASDLADSEALGRDARWWDELYARVFSGRPVAFAGSRYNEDRVSQRAGIDRHLDFADGHVETVDEKVETRDFDDFVLEVWSSEEERVPGWVLGGKSCDWLGWVVLPARSVWLLDYRAVCDLYETRKWAWRDAGYRVCRARNRGYTTVSVSVPRREVLRNVPHLFSPVDRLPQVIGNPGRRR